MPKPRKVEEPAGTYAVSPKRPAPLLVTPVNPEVRRTDTASFRKAANKVFKTHDDLFRKLAQ